MNNNINYEEIRKFEKLSSEWWDPNGKLKLLHKFNTPRFNYILNTLEHKFDKPITKKSKILDIGCGGGILTEEFAKIAGNVVGVDATKGLIDIAIDHSKKNNLNNIEYIHSTPEQLDLNKHQESYDVVLALEIIEHVDNIDDFIASLVKFVKQDGFLIISSINRTLWSLIFAKFAAEYLLRWLPRNTHSFDKFVKPSEVSAILNNHDFSFVNLKGIGLNFTNFNWKITNNTSMNYIGIAKRNFKS